MLNKNPRKPVCHPDRPHRAKDLCKECYQKNFNKNQYMNEEGYAEKVKKRSKEYRINNRKKYARVDKNKHLQRKFGIGIEIYEAMKIAQGNLCKICHKPESVKSRGNKVNDLAVDHNHSNGKIRGLLCFKCNTTIAHIESNFGILEKIQKYLEE